MKSEWVTIPLGDVLTLQRGHDLPTQNRLSGEIPILGSSGITGFHNEAKATGPGVTVGRSGNSMGEISYSDKDFWPLNTALYVTDFKGNDPKFLYYLLQTIDFDQFNSGSAQKSLNRNAVYPFEVEIPKSRAEQERISSVLSSLEEKVGVNQKINQTLEQMAQAIFKSWFVDFEPVKAKIAALEAGGSEEDALLAAMQVISGKGEAELTRLQTEQPEQYAKLRTTAELFPSAMQDSELGEIPEGWNPSTVGHEFDVTMGQSPPGDTYNEEGEGAPFFQGRRDFGERFPSNRVYCSAPKRMANEGDTLLSVRAPVGDTNIALTNCCIGRGLAALRHKSQSSSFTYYSVKQLGKELASYDSEGTVFGSINQKNLKALSVIKPCAQLVGAFDNYAGSLDKTIFTKSKESQTLKQTRDTLLPKLLSGELIINSPADSEEIL